MPKRYLRDSDGHEEPSYFSDDPVDLVINEPKGFKAKINKALMLFVLLGTTSLFVGNTLAANINLGGQSFEFGQGVTGLKACSNSNSLTIKQGAEYTTSGFKLKTVELSGIPASCHGYNLILSVLTPGADGSSTLGTLFSRIKKLILLDRYGTFYSSASDGNFVTLTSTYDSATVTDSVLITFKTPTLLISDIGTLGIESSDNVLTSLSCGVGGDCAVGETGPLGGKVVAFFQTPFQAPGSACNLKCLGLELSPSDGNRSDQWTDDSGNNATSGTTLATNSGLGAGYPNTKLAFEAAGGSNKSAASYGAVAYCWNKSTASATDRWYLPSVMEYAYIFNQVKQNAAFRTAAPGFPAVTNYYSSEEVSSSYNITSYRTAFNAGNPPLGIALENYTTGVTPASTQALAVAPARQVSPSFLAVSANFADFAGMRVFQHPKASGYAYICLHAFN